MLLSDKSILSFIREQKITVLPEFNESDIRPTGLRVYLGTEILIAAENQVIDLGSYVNPKYAKLILSSDGYALEPNKFVLASTAEKVQVPRDIVCTIDGRSTVARLGLTVHCSSTVIDGNFMEPRSIVLELFNQSSNTLLLKPGIAIAMLQFHQLTEPIQQNSQVQYRGQSEVMPPNLEVQKR